MSQPRHVHKCNDTTCTYLGQHNNYDLYVTVTNYGTRYFHLQHYNSNYSQSENGAKYFKAAGAVIGSFEEATVHALKLLEASRLEPEPTHPFPKDEIEEQLSNTIKLHSFLGYHHEYDMYSVEFKDDYKIFVVVDKNGWTWESHVGVKDFEHETDFECIALYECYMKYSSLNNTINMVSSSPQPLKIGDICSKCKAEYKSRLLLSSYIECCMC